MIKIDDLYFKFGNKVILNHINYSFENKKYVLLGDNGCGKTTLFRCLCGYYKNYEGKIINEGKEKINIGYLPQKFGFYTNLSVKENLEYIAHLRGYTNVYEQVNIAIEKTKLNEEMRKKVRILSGGMLQRLGIAQAIIGNPDLLLLDEPTVGLDIGQRRNFYNLINNLDFSVPIIISTHIPEDAKNFAEEIIIMKNSKLYKTDWDVSKDNIEDKYLCFRE